MQNNQPLVSGGEGEAAFFIAIEGNGQKDLPNVHLKNMEVKQKGKEVGNNDYHFPALEFNDP